jgi:hypothetical protein
MPPATTTPTLQTPVALLVFNRPETTRRVFAEVARARPANLFIIADGPRAGHPADVARCAEVRQIVSQVDWPCTVQREYAADNLGRSGVTRAISGFRWLFECVDEAIILEDDCVPHPSFFRFCAELLERYRDNEQIAQISGSNYHYKPTTDRSSYHFSRYPNICGWATWRRAWKAYDGDLSAWSNAEDRQQHLRMFGTRGERNFWQSTWQRLTSQTLQAWDYQWILACLMDNKLTIKPNVNLISNIGYGADATHTTGNSILANLPLQPMPFPLRHPADMRTDRTKDRYIQELLYTQRNLPGRIAYKLKRELLFLTRRLR